MGPQIGKPVNKVQKKGINKTGKHFNYQILFVTSHNFTVKLKILQPNTAQSVR